MCEQNKKQYIEREEAKETVKYIPYCDWKTVGDWLDEIPAADVVEVVRCGECIHNYGVKADCEFNPHDIVCDWWSTDGMDETDFCSRGERRTK